MNINDIIAVQDMNNARGYPLTGQLLKIDDKYATVNAFGLYGPGSETLIHDIPIEKIKEIKYDSSPVS